MRTHFAEVLARESACLAMVTDRAELVGWRRRVVEELMTPSSPYALALRQTCDMRARADFLDQWRELIAETVERLVRSGTTGDRRSTSDQDRGVDVDAQKTAVLILAALQGGCALSRIAQDPRPLNAALDLALVPFAATWGNLPEGE
ncbi:hypothetical protein PGH47_00580 [Streptomyces sp. HUAS 31]|uniref:LmrA/YxaF family transcription factor n=1 Tax=Streptomyces sp. HUAS 31 TaxID=3020055 RepID=UPI002305EDD3|nr:hypothetical protein [Streptomyces sp. HUAS 31]WCD94223.1 hypothetical protein PGH47_00580 [Streptomyces sp. HUAS 31]